MNRLLRLLVENEILRLSVWDNPTNDLKRRSDPAGLLETAMAEVRNHYWPDREANAISLQGNWRDEVRHAWKIDPRLVVFMPERFKSVVLEMEVGKHIRAHTREVLDAPDALRFVAGDRLNSAALRDMKVVIALIKEADADVSSFSVCPSLGSRHTGLCGHVFRAAILQ